MGILPSKQRLVQFLGNDDFFLWEYYGEGIFGRILGLIFKSRIKALMGLLNKLDLNFERVVDVGCGPCFVSYALASKMSGEYIGVDIISAAKLRRYKDAMKNEGVKNIEIVRASAEFLPFRAGAFDFVLSLDVLEHLQSSREAIKEIHRVVKNGGIVAISLPLENLFQKWLRVGFALMKLIGDPILKDSKRVPIGKTPNYHYAGDVKSHDEMFRVLIKYFRHKCTKYTPIGLHKSLNINALHIFQK